MSKRWRTQADVTIAEPMRFHNEAARRWWKMALYLSFPRFSPEYLDDDVIEQVVNETWEGENNPVLFDIDR